jgi:dienelactone hydrolase
MKFIKIKCLLLILVFCKINTALGQKKNIDSNAYAKWSSVKSPSINANGKYAFYEVENEPLRSRTLVVQSLENNWKKSFKNAKGQNFISIKGRDYAVILNENDSLMVISLGTNLIQSIPNIKSFTTCRNGESEWMSYHLNLIEKEIVFQNLNTGKKYTYHNVSNHILGDDGQTVILQIERKVGSQLLWELRWIDLGTLKSNLIWEGTKADRIVLDVKHRQLAFTSENSLFTYSMATRKLNCLINNQSTPLDSGLKLAVIQRFSNDGNRLFIDLKEKEKPKPKSGAVEVWSYLDHKLQTQQENEIKARTYVSIVDLFNGKIIRLEKEFEHLSFNSFEKSSDTVGIIIHDSKLRDGFFGNQYDLISLKSGKRIPLKYPPESLSPRGKYLVYIDQHNYVLYNIKTGIGRTIPKAFSENRTKQSFERHGIAGWLENDEAVLFYDDYDIWKIDLSGQNVPVNLTLGLGRKQNLAFSIVYGQYYPYPLDKSQKIVLAAFNLKSKQNGFYSLELGKINRPELLSMGDYIYCVPSGVQVELEYFSPPVKAKKANVYIVSRMNAKEAPNYFITNNFKTFKALSKIYPEREYNWYTTELHTWTSFDGKVLQGILYKPDNFDPDKKYPVVFNYYDRKSDNLNVYLKPQCENCNINISTYTSNGYLVFTPDIVYKIGDPMQGTYDAVVSAAKYISSLPYVNPAKMGIQGCSWGGLQTNYLVTHTNLFAAACSASGLADWISSYGRLTPSTGQTLLGMFEVGQFRMGSSVWEIPDAYIKNSPIFQLDKITTPFLIMHTKSDSGCPFEDAIELFNGLRRLGKKSWMLVYPDADHGVYGKDAEDFNTRMMQFFDHYLKDKPAPIWMTTAIPPEKRGLVNDLLYDTKIKTPGSGLLTPEEQKTVDSLMTKKPILIELK